MGTSAVVSSYDPTALYAGNGPFRARSVSLGANQNPAPTVTGGFGGITANKLPRGTLLGRSVTAGSAAAAAVSSNTGNGTLTMDGSTPVLPASVPGVYKVAFTAATAFTVTDPYGNVLGNGIVATAFSAGNAVKFNTAAGSTAFVAGDTFNITVVPVDEYIVSKTTASDGSQTPVAILAADADTSSGSISGMAYFEGEFAFEIMNVDPTWTLSSLSAALREAASPLYVRSVGVLG